MKSVRLKTVLAVVSVLVVTAGALVGATVAQADSVQVQSYQRASEAAACAAQPGETPWQASWGTDSSWKPSWEQWANAGKGGWTCTRSITWARDSAARVYNVGDIGPGGGLVFLISGGLTYEMAPKTWSGAGSPDAGATWCDGGTSVPSAVGTAIGTGAANTAAMAASTACSSNAAAAVLAYAPSGTSAGQWFLPSKDELNAMCYYSRNLSASPDPTVSCYGVSGTSQNTTFGNGSYGFASVVYWSSSQDDAFNAWYQSFEYGGPYYVGKGFALRVRAVRVF